MTTDLTTYMGIGSNTQSGYWEGAFPSTGVSPYNRYVDITLPTAVNINSIPMVQGRCANSVINSWQYTAQLLYCELINSTTLRVSSPGAQTYAAFRWYVLS